MCQFIYLSTCQYVNSSICLFCQFCQFYNNSSNSQYSIQIKSAVWTQLPSPLITIVSICLFFNNLSICQIVYMSFVSILQLTNTSIRLIVNISKPSYHHHKGPYIVSTCQYMSIRLHNIVYAWQKWDCKHILGDDYYESTLLLQFYCVNFSFG